MPRYIKNNIKGCLRKNGKKYNKIYIKKSKNISEAILKDLFKKNIKIYIENNILNIY